MEDVEEMEEAKEAKEVKEDDYEYENVQVKFNFNNTLPTLPTQPIKIFEIILEKNVGRTVFIIFLFQ